MGGFVFDTRSTTLNFLPDERDQLTLTASGLLFLAEHAPALLPDIPTAGILDKSKVDGLGKTIVLLQALWFCVQVMCRLIAHLSISLLELTTFVHGICFLVVYLIWWSKPLDINTPTFITIRDLEDEEMCAAMVMRSSIGMIRKPSTRDMNLEGSTDNPFFIGGCLIYDDTMDLRASPSPVDESNVVSSLNIGQRNGTNGSDDLQEPTNDSQTLRTNERCHGFILKATAEMPILKHAFSEHCATIKLEPSDVRCLQLAARWIEREKTFPVRDLSRTKKRLEGRQLFYRINADNYYTFNGVEYLVPKATDTAMELAKFRDLMLRYWFVPPFEGLGQLFKEEIGKTPIWDIPGLQFVVSVNTIGSIFGALHLLAWDCPFPSRAELILWRLSGILIIAPFPIMLLIIITAVIWHVGRGPTLLKSRDSESSNEIWLVQKVWFAINLGFSPFYVLARVYLLVGSLINLAYLPDDVFEETPWSRYLPHFGAG